ncbi:hypothetical protein [Streptomyces sp. HNM0574]|uniref:hypothetical protein n=1 Tax=Streptomyces sp. HNM0574 TaxID=2714954 RepID=UPI00146DD966|nr:hypothetical protein [Streptomyces sp. HNM0574]NLU67004.1 hypothetical protein [Streptomyces sp. HNM0574]
MTDQHDHDPLKHQHRFILLGEKHLVAYHLSLFKVPAHAYQAVLSITMEPEAAKQAYLTDLHKEKPGGFAYYYSMLTAEEFPLIDIRDGKRTSMEVYLERVTVDKEQKRTFTRLKDGNGKEVKATVKFPDAVRYFEDTETNAAYPEKYTGLLFGTPEETFLAHKLVKKEHWDEVISVTDVKVKGQAPTQTLLDGVPLVTVPAIPEKPYLKTKSPMEPKSAQSGTVKPRSGGDAAPLTFTVSTQRWWNHTSLNTATP